MKRILKHPLFQLAAMLLITFVSACAQDAEPPWMENAVKSDEQNGNADATTFLPDYGKSMGGRGGRR